METAYMCFQKYKNFTSSMKNQINQVHYLKEYKVIDKKYGL